MQTREKILKTFWDLYVDHPLEEISVAQITTLAGIHRSTFYHHFQDRYEVLETIENQLIDELIPMINEVTFYDLEGKLRNLYHFFRRNGLYLKHLVGLQRDPNFANRLRKLLEQVLDRICQELFVDITPAQKTAVSCAASGVWVSFLMSASCNDLPEDRAIAMMMELIYNGWLPGLVKVYGLKVQPVLVQRYLRKNENKKADV